MKDAATLDRIRRRHRPADDGDAAGRRPNSNWSRATPASATTDYIRRRKELFALCRRHRLERLGPPLIEYTPEETRIWREVSPKLDELHVKHASADLPRRRSATWPSPATRSRSCGT